MLVGRVGFEPTRYCYFTPVPKTGEASISPPAHFGAQFLYTVYRAPPTVVFYKNRAKLVGPGRFELPKSTL